MENDSLFFVDIDTAQELKVLNISELFSQARYIPLETNASSLIGRITQLCVKGDTLLILDAVVTKKVQAFHRNGKHISVVGARGHGPEEYRQPSSIGIDGAFLYVYDADVKRLLFYDVNTLKFSHSVKLDISTANRYVAMLNNRIYTDAYDWEAVNPFLIQEIDMESGQTVQRWLPTKDYNLGFLDATYFTGEVSFYGSQQSIKYHQMFSDTIMQITNEGVFPYLCLRSKHLVNREDLLKLQKEKGVFFSNIQKELTGIYNVHHYVEWGKYISFSFCKRNYVMNVIFNKETRTFVLSNSLHNDLVFARRDKSLNIIPIQGDTKGLYGYIHPLAMEHFLELLQGGLVNVSDNDRLVLSNLAEDANPILIYYE